MNISSDYVVLNNGVKMPRIGFGAYQLADGEIAVNSMLAALDTGYRAIDTAISYHNEASVGEAIRRSGLRREEVFVTTKIHVENLGYDLTMKGFAESMERFGFSYLDLCLIHWPIPMKRGAAASTWKALEELYHAGKIRAIGVSNFTISLINELLDKGTVIPVVNQIEFTPYNQQTALLDYCRSLDIKVSAWSPLARSVMLRQPVFQQLAQKYQRTPAQIVLRWDLQHDILPLPRSKNPEHIRQNSELYDFELSPEDMQMLDGLDIGLRLGSDPELYTGNREENRKVFRRFEAYFER